MNFTKFKSEIEILHKNDADNIRNKYIHNFVNSSHELYQEQIQTLHKFVDGYCYLGYLWDYINNPVIIGEDDIKKLAAKIEEIYVFWDIHSCERIFIRDYWKFEKKAVLKMNIDTLLQGEKYLPEDIYIFDNTFTWTLIKTHEDIDGKRYCIKSGVF